MHAEQPTPSPVANAPARREDLSESTEPRIYVACLAAYNNGCLHGCWIDVTDTDQIQNAVRAMLAASPEPDSEEWAIHDYEGFEGVALSEWSSFEHVCELAEFISEHGALGAKVLRHFDEDLEASRAAFEDYAGEYKSLGDFAAELYDQTGEAIPSSLEHYIDWDAMGRDFELGGDIFSIETVFHEVHVFWSR